MSKAKVYELRDAIEAIAERLEDGPLSNEAREYWATTLRAVLKGGTKIE